MKIEPGVIAYLVRPWGEAETLGMAVTVVRKAAPGERVCARDGAWAEAVFDNGLPCSEAWLCDCASSNRFPRMVHADCLLPIAGPSSEFEDDMPLPLVVEWV